VIKKTIFKKETDIVMLWTLFCSSIIIYKKESKKEKQVIKSLSSEISLYLSVILC